MFTSVQLLELIRVTSHVSFKTARSALIVYEYLYVIPLCTTNRDRSLRATHCCMHLKTYATGQFAYINAVIKKSVSQKIALTLHLNNYDVGVPNFPKIQK